MLLIFRVLKSVPFMYQDMPTDPNATVQWTLEALMQTPLEQLMYASLPVTDPQSQSAGLTPGQQSTPATPAVAITQI